MIVREARRWLVAAAAVAAAIHVTAGHLAGVAAWGIVASLSWLFRDPPRRGNVHPLTLFSPVNGTVLEAGERNDPYRCQEALGVSLRGSWSGPYLLRSPIEGQIVATWDGWRVSAPGRERVGRALCIRTDEDDEVVLAYAPRVPALHRIRV
ncbi:MAG: hypothetical protein R3298_06545, partial [Gammaproteobacteria bacterium]|nr:hypothetical protein [Gammaproteobacteria bacterium]